MTRSATVNTIFAFWFAVLGAVISSSTAWSAPVLKSASAVSKGKDIQITLTFSQAVPYQMFTLYGASPRLVLDTQSVKINTTVFKAGALFKKVRVGNQPNNVYRTVWELHKKYRIKTYGYKGATLSITLTTGSDTTVRRSPSWGKNKSVNLDAKKKATRVVVIDAGHGGHDPGAIGIHKVHEKDITLKAAFALRNELQKKKNYRVILTRTTDTYIKLKDRYRIAEKNKADLFISLHADKLENKNVRGLSVYSLFGESLEQQVKKIRNNDEEEETAVETTPQSSDPIVNSILRETQQKGIAHCSKRFADDVIEYIKRRSPIKTLRNTLRPAGFAVLKSQHVPAVLVEMGFLSNSTDEKILQTAKFRGQFAFYMTRAIDDYMNKREKIGCLN